MKKSIFFAPLALSALVACDTPNAMGEANSLIIIAADSLWQDVEQATYDVLEPTIFTVRDEKQYVVTAVPFDDPAIIDLSLFQNVLVFGGPDDPALQQVADAGGFVLSTMEPGRVFQVEDVWARNQIVTGVYLRRRFEVDTWIKALPSVLAAVDESYRSWVRNRMFATPPDTALAADLERRFGFSMLVPTVYDHVVRDLGGGDSLVIIRNDNPDPSVLIRSVLVHWRPPVDSLTADLALEWRASLDDEQYNVAQGISTENSSVTQFMVDGRPALEVTGVWHDERGDFPAAGPFVAWLVDCPSRTYFIDAWLYAPNEEKYQYMLQLQEILGSFSCS
ncbi:MAG: DUF4837 family protein [Gemmatimonadota bacterium]|nr:DUF4837 family protein [Gemmatimonadota bacterium]